PPAAGPSQRGPARPGTLLSAPSSASSKKRATYATKSLAFATYTCRLFRAKPPAAPPFVTLSKPFSTAPRKKWSPHSSVAKSRASPRKSSIVSPVLLRKAERKVDHVHVRRLRTRSRVSTRMQRQGHHSSRVCMDHHDGSPRQFLRHAPPRVGRRDSRLASASILHFPTSLV